MERDLNARRGESSLSISFLVLAYSLAPEEATFPTQLCEAAATLSHLIVVANRSPSSIMLAGDSAGGALALSLLSHILHPRPDVPQIRISEPLRGVFLLSPWVSFSTEFSSYTKNADSDMLTATVLKRWSTFYLGKMDAFNERPVQGLVQSEDMYAEAFLAAPSWWSGLGQTIDSMLIWVGEQELFFDPITGFVSKLRDGWKSKDVLDRDIMLVKGRNEAHIGPIVNLSLGNKSKKDSQVVVEAWLSERLSPERPARKSPAAQLPPVLVP